MSSKDILVYTDGSAVVRGTMAGHGGFGTYFPNLFGKTRAFSKGFSNTKTGRMEIMALYVAIKVLPKNSSEKINLICYSDSEYVVKTFTENRLEKWISNNWQNSSGEVKNIDLWKAVKRELNKRPFLSLHMKHIRSHQVDKCKDIEKKKELLKNPHIRGNLIVDRLADYKRHKKFYENDFIK